MYIGDKANPKKKLYTALREPDLSYLSHSDLEMLRWAMDTVRKLSFGQLKKLTHEDPAYQEAWNRRGGAKSVAMKVELFFLRPMAKNEPEESSIHLRECMTTSVGDVVRAFTKRAKGKRLTPKYHLCVCDKHWHFLFISKHEYPGDHPISDADCPYLELPYSFISLSRVLHVPNLASGAEIVCKVSDEFLRGLYQHAQISTVMAQIDRKKVLEEIARKLGDQQKTIREPRAGPFASMRARTSTPPMSDDACVGQRAPRKGCPNTAEIAAR